MIAYLDTSALIKKYIEEDGSTEVVRHWNSAEILVISTVGYAEFFSAINRKKRDGVLPDEKYSMAIEEFQDDWRTIEQIEVTDQLNEKIAHLTTLYPLRGFDAIHLASALYFQESVAEPVIFLCADRRLNDAARNERLIVVDLAQ